MKQEMGKWKPENCFPDLDLLKYPHVSQCTEGLAVVVLADLRNALGVS